MCVQACRFFLTPSARTRARARILCAAESPTARVHARLLSCALLDSRAARKIDNYQLALSQAAALTAGFA